mgnify:CR=1 FL=1
MTSEPSGNEPTRGPRPTVSQGPGPSQISDAYLRRSIAEIEDLNRRVLECPGCRPADELPVLASGSPQADIMLIKWSASLAERQEGVAFFGRAGSALLKSVERLGIDPVTIYGTLVAKCPHSVDGVRAEWLAEEIAIVIPKILVIMGDDTREAVNALDYPLSQTVEATQGEIQSWTPTIDALVVPDIDESLDEQRAKRDFWAAFRALGTWHEEQPPY